MGFELTEEQQIIQSSIREFVRNEVEPIADRIDRDGIFPAETMKKLADLEMTGIPYPSEYGGGGADFVS